MILPEGTVVRISNKREGWLTARIIRYIPEFVPGIESPVYEILILEGSKRGETRLMPPEYIEPVEEYPGWERIYPAEPSKPKKEELLKLEKYIAEEKELLEYQPVFSLKTLVPPASKDIEQIDREYTYEQLKMMARKAGLSSSGDKKTIIRRLVEAGKIIPKMVYRPFIPSRDGLLQHAVELPEEYTIKVTTVSPMDTFEEPPSCLETVQGIKYPVRYIELGATIYDSTGERVGHASYYYIPSLHIGCFEDPIVAAPAPGQAKLLEDKMRRFVTMDLVSRSAKHVYDSECHLVF
jgi:hypothetical protein